MTSLGLFKKIAFHLGLYPFFKNNFPQKYTGQISLMSHTKPQVIHNGNACSALFLCARHIRLSLSQIAGYFEASVLPGLMLSVRSLTRLAVKWM